MKIAEAARCSGLSAPTIRFYEASKLLPVIARGQDGHRNFTKENVDWLILLASLRDTGMSNENMRHFAHLYRQGDTTVAERREMLRRHQDALEIQRETLARCQNLLTYKLARYAEILGETP